MSFFLNLRYQWAFDSNIILDGIVYSASGIDQNSFFRRDSPVDYTYKKLFDPQLYLINRSNDFGIKPTTSTNDCARLSSYPWIPGICPNKSPEMGHREWMTTVKNSLQNNWSNELPDDFQEIKESIKKCFDFQIDAEVDVLISPSTLITNSGSSLEDSMTWIDAAIEVISEEDYNKPFYATLAVSDISLKDQPPTNNSFIEAIVDQVTSREEIEGIYFVLQRSTIGQRRLSNKYTAESILFIAFLFTQKFGYKFFTNYCEEFGFISLGAGANYFASGDTLKSRRLHFPDYIERGGGSNYPYFYSLNHFSDFRAITDLTNLNSQGLLQLMDIEETVYSKDLINALNDDSIDINSVPEWAEDLNNVAQARNHYIALLSSQSREIMKLDLSNRTKLINNMLLNAEMKMMYINDRIENEELLENENHVKIWRSALERFLKNRKNYT